MLSNPNDVAFKLLSIFAMLILLDAFAGNPYSYYILLCYVVCIAAIGSALAFRAVSKESWFITFLIIAFLFNPLVLAHLNRQLWIVLDLITAGMFFISIFKFRSCTQRFSSND